MKRVLVVLCVLVLAAVAYAGGYHLRGHGTVVNTVAASGASSATAIELDGINMLDRKSLVGYVIVEPSATTSRGYGLADTCNIIIRSDGIDVDSTWKAGLPCTSFVAITSVIGDTLFREDAYIYIKIADSSADSTFTASHNVKWSLIAR